MNKNPWQLALKMYEAIVTIRIALIIKILSKQDPKNTIVKTLREQNGDH